MQALEKCRPQIRSDDLSILLSDCFRPQPIDAAAATAAAVVPQFGAEDMLLPGATKKAPPSEPLTRGAVTPSALGGAQLSFTKRPCCCENHAGLPNEQTCECLGIS